MAIQNVLENQRVEFLNAGLIDPDETILSHVLGDYWEFILRYRGQYFFTSKRVIFRSMFKNYSVRYDEMKDVKTCGVGTIPILPFGIKITYFDAEKNKDSARVLSLFPRKKWFELINNNRGVRA